MRRPRKLSRAPRSGAEDGQRVFIEGIGAGGAGVGRLSDGRVVFVHRTAPGDEALVEVTSSKRSWSRGRLLEVLRPARGRREAPCPHYHRCGGCTLEHMDYPGQLRAKARIVADALQRIGGTRAALPDVVPSPKEFRYRNRVSFTLLRLEGGRVVAGFHELERPGRILDLGGDCLLPERAIAEAWDGVRKAWGENARRLPSGRELRLTLRGTEAGAVGLLVEGGYGPGRPEELLDAVPRLVSVWHRPESARALRFLAGTKQLEEAGGRLRLAGNVFLQVNRRAAAGLETYVRERSGDVAGLRVVDAYCGVGERAHDLAAAGARVTGIERSPEAVDEARRRAKADIRFLRGGVEDLLAEALPADLVILNPPRAGLDARVAETLSERPPRRVVYVSCDPATLARDLGRMEPFRLVSVRCFDLFPQTAHVETVAELECDTM